MKQLSPATARTMRYTALFALIFFAFIISARAQILPYVDCVELERNADGGGTGKYTAYFGYVNLGSAQYIPTTSSSNVMGPIRNPPGQPDTFYPGAHPRVFSIKLDVNASQTWYLTRYSTTASFSERSLCSDDGANSRLMTYQGKLSDGGPAANGVYDLQFQLFNQATGGTAQTTQITLEDVTVVNGIFTVQLDLGAAAVTANAPSRLNSAILGAENSFFEIGVRAGTSTGSFTTLNPRQPLTAVPLAMRANTANTAFHATFADLAANATNATNATNAANAANATNSSQLGGAAASQFVRTDDSRLSDARTPSAGSGNYIQNTTTQQPTSSFNISGNGIVGGTSTASNFRARGGAPGADNANNTGYAFSGNGDSDSGLFSNGNGQVSLYADSVERARVTTSGMQIFGALTANTKNFKIDHPLDPLNKTLTYTSIESPEMMNIYNGNITTDGNGEAIVSMPAYFEALNRDFRYQLTVIGTFAQAIVLKEIAGNQFLIKTDQSNVRVSWQVTGIRRDRFAEDHRPAVEQEKPANERGKCLYAPACENPKLSGKVGEPLINKR